MITGRRVRVVLPGLTAFCSGSPPHPIPRSLHPLPHGIHRCSHLDRGRSSRCDAVSWVWAHRDGICLVVPVTETEARIIESARMSDLAVLQFIGLADVAA